jgi:hypothetical protein
LIRLRAFTEPREARLRNVSGIRSTLRHLPDKDRLFSRRWPCALGQPESLQSRGLFTDNLCLGFVAHREFVILPRTTAIALACSSD